MMTYTVLKSLHIIFVVTWFAGLFYMFRLFVYHAEAAAKPEPDRTILLRQYGIMEKRLWYIITWPSCILTLVFGIWLLVVMPHYLQEPWMHLKLFFVACLLAYQFFGQRAYKKLQTQPSAYSSFGMRIWNEVGTLLLVSIVFLVINRDSISWIWGSLGLLGLGAILAFSVKAYKKNRERKKTESV